MSDPNIPRAIDPNTDEPFGNIANPPPETKPWWTSKIMLASVAGLIIYVLRLIGLETDNLKPADIEYAISELVGFVMLIVTIWARIKGHSKPIASKVFPTKSALLLIFLLPAFFLSSCKTVDTLMAGAGISWDDVGRVAKNAGIKAAKVFVFDFRDGVVEELDTGEPTSAKTVVVIAPTSGN